MVKEFHTDIVSSKPLSDEHLVSLSEILAAWGYEEFIIVAPLPVEDYQQPKLKPVMVPGSSKVH